MDRDMNEPQGQNWADRMLKKAMPNGTVIRRYVAAGLISGAVFVMVSVRQIDRTNTNANRGADAICAIILYGETTLESLPENPRASSDAGKRFVKLIRDMRETGVHCTPPPPKP